MTRQASGTRLRRPTILPPKVSHEALLVLAAARSVLDGATAAQIEELLRLKPRFDDVRALAREHNVLPLASRNLAAVGGAALPPTVRQTLQRDLLAVTQYNLFATAELLRLLQLLGLHGIRAVPFKGPVLAATLYGHPALRQFGDLDLLVHRHDALRARDLLLRHGYRYAELGRRPPDRAYLRFQHHFALVRDDGQAHVELHYEIRERYFAVPFDVSRLMQRLEPAKLHGTEVRTFAPEDLLLILCVHGASHGWERLVWICDIAELLRQQRDLAWARIADEAAALGITRMLHVGLLLTHELLGTALPSPIAERAHSDRAARRLCHDVGRQLFGPRDAGLRSRILFHLRARERPRDRLHYGLRLLVTPTEGDWDAIALPERLSGLYYLVRPFRLWRSYRGR